MGNARCVRGEPERQRGFGAAGLYCQVTEPGFQPKDNV